MTVAATSPFRQATSRREALIPSEPSNPLNGRNRRVAAELQRNSRIPNRGTGMPGGIGNGWLTGPGSTCCSAARVLRAEPLDPGDEDEVVGRIDQEGD